MDEYYRLQRALDEQQASVKAMQAQLEARERAFELQVQQQRKAEEQRLNDLNAKVDELSDRLLQQSQLENRRREVNEKLEASFNQAADRSGTSTEGSSQCKGQNKPAKRRIKPEQQAAATTLIRPKQPRPERNTHNSEARAFEQAHDHARESVNLVRDYIRSTDTKSDTLPDHLVTAAIEAIEHLDSLGGCLQITAQEIPLWEISEQFMIENAQYLAMSKEERQEINGEFFPLPHTAERERIRSKLFTVPYQSELGRSCVLRRGFILPENFNIGLMVGELHELDDAELNGVRSNHMHIIDRPGQTPLHLDGHRRCTVGACINDYRDLVYDGDELRHISCMADPDSQQLRPAEITSLVHKDQDGILMHRTTQSICGHDHTRFLLTDYGDDYWRSRFQDMVNDGLYPKQNDLYGRHIDCQSNEGALDRHVPNAAALKALFVSLKDTVAQTQRMPLIPMSVRREQVPNLIKTLHSESYRSLVHLYGVDITDIQSRESDDRIRLVGKTILEHCMYAIDKTGQGKVDRDAIRQLEDKELRKIDTDEASCDSNAMSVLTTDDEELDSAASATCSSLESEDNVNGKRPRKVKPTTSRMHQIRRTSVAHSNVRAAPRQADSDASFRAFMQGEPKHKKAAATQRTNLKQSTLSGFFQNLPATASKSDSRLQSAPTRNDSPRTGDQRWQSEEDTARALAAAHDDAEWLRQSATAAASSQRDGLSNRLSQEQSSETRATVTQKSYQLTPGGMQMFHSPQRSDYHTDFSTMRSGSSPSRTHVMQWHIAEDRKVTLKQLLHRSEKYVRKVDTDKRLMGLKQVYHFKPGQVTRIVVPETEMYNAKSARPTITEYMTWLTTRFKDSHQEPSKILNSLYFGDYLSKHGGTRAAWVTWLNNNQIPAYAAEKWYDEAHPEGPFTDEEILFMEVELVRVMIERCCDCFYRVQDASQIMQMIQSMRTPRPSDRTTWKTTFNKFLDLYQYVDEVTRAGQNQVSLFEKIIMNSASAQGSSSAERALSKAEQGISDWNIILTEMDVQKRLNPHLGSDQLLSQAIIEVDNKLNRALAITHPTSADDFTGALTSEDINDSQNRGRSRSRDDRRRGRSSDRHSSRSRSRSPSLEKSIVRSMVINDDHDEVTRDVDWTSTRTHMAADARDEEESACREDSIFYIHGLSSRGAPGSYHGPMNGSSNRSSGQRQSFDRVPCSFCGGFHRQVQPPEPQICRYQIQDDTEGRRGQFNLELLASDIANSERPVLSHVAYVVNQKWPKSSVMRTASAENKQKLLKLVESLVPDRVSAERAEANGSNNATTTGANQGRK